MRRLVPVLLTLALGAPAPGELAHVRGFEISRGPYGEWEALALLDHEDEGWGHFCDQWEVLDQDGERIVLRHLASPKIKDVEEKGPVRRRHRAFPLPDGTTALTVRAHCKRSGWGGESFSVDLSRREGPGYRVDAQDPGLLPSFEGVEAFLTPRLRRHVNPPRRWPYPPRGPIPETPPDPVDLRPRTRLDPRWVREPR